MVYRIRFKVYGVRYKVYGLRYTVYGKKLETLNRTPYTVYLKPSLYLNPSFINKKTRV